MLRERGYRQVSLPIALVEKIEEYLGKHPELGFTSVPEFIRQAIREKLNNSKK
ncbi:MAG: ribbon-helix-helix domain-containing protein [Candidatus Helarchaeota archaeon]